MQDIESYSTKCLHLALELICPLPPPFFYETDVYSLGKVGQSLCLLSQKELCLGMIRCTMYL